MSEQLFAKSVHYFAVENFLQLNETIYSKNFKTDSTNEWRICFDPNNTVVEIKYLSVFLYLEKSQESIIRAKYEVYVIDSSTQRKYKIMFTIHEYTAGGVGCGFNYFIKRDQLLNNKNELLPNNRLTLCVVIEVLDTNHRNNNYINFEELLRTGQFSDFRFIIHKKSFPVHKIILSSRSSVFKTMFSTDMKEKEENVGYICDIDSEVFQEFLNFIYLNEMPKMEEFAENLLYVSDKYNVIELKNICESFLNFNINIENALYTLIIFDEFNSYFRENAIQFIANNILVIQNTPKNRWLEFQIKNPFLVNEIIETIAKQLPKSLQRPSMKNLNFPKL